MFTPRLPKIDCAKNSNLLRLLIWENIFNIVQGLGTFDPSAEILLVGLTLLN